MVIYRICKSKNIEMKRKINIFRVFLTIFPVLVLSGCFLFQFPYEFNNPLDPNYKSEGTMELTEEYGRGLYEGRNGISFPVSIDVTLDGSHILMGDKHKPEILKYDIGPGDEEYISLGEDAEPVVDIAALSGEAYVATKNAVYRVDLGNNGVELMGEFEDFGVRYYDIDDADGVGYMITHRSTEEGEAYHLRWFDENGNELGSKEDDMFWDAGGMAVSQNYVYISSNYDHCINVLDQSDHTLVSQIFFNGSAIEQFETTVRSGYSDQYSYYDLNWDPTNSQLAAVISGMPSGTLGGAFIHTDTTTVYPAWTLSTSLIDDYSDWQYIAAGKDPVVGTVYAADGVFRKLVNTDTDTVIHTAPEAEDDEFLLVTDMDFRSDGTHFFIDELQWSAHTFDIDSGGWGRVGYTGRYVPAAAALEYPKAVGVNDDRTYVAMQGGGSVLQIFEADGTYLTDINLYPAGYNYIPDIELFDGGEIALWDDDSKNIGYLEEGSSDGRWSPFSSDETENCDLFIDGERTYAAVSYHDYSFICYFNGTEYEHDAYQRIWRSDEVSFFSGDNFSQGRPYYIDHIFVTDDHIWALFPNIGAAAKFSKSGDLIGTVCLSDGFTGERVLPNRFFDFYAYPEYNDRRYGGFTVLETEEDGVAVDYLRVFDNDVRRLKEYRITFPEEGLSVR